MRIIPVINHLKANSPLLQNRVETAQSLSALSDEEIENELPIAFIYPGKEIAAKSQLINKTNQMQPMQLNVLIAAPNADAINEPLEDVRDQIKSALISFQIDSQHDYFSFVQGDIVDVSKRYIWWKDTFETWTFLTN